ncbi:MAG: NAD(P)/FAD-dependent oxidoreductase [Pseudomonadales bacterium]|jgi:cation diffusion facilitator CzcD-associated flavoprotein CzcO|nr:NAD(P)/FAD-dependent oxidoreductase [Pseudomonadales bacterium]MDG1441294.1 NAD(P)/FAD-dependent oxidoreductase [Pseudomonadales bacterium]
MPRPDHPQSYYDDIKDKFKQARDVRLDYRPPGTDQFTSEFSGELAKYAVDPYAKEVEQRDPITDQVEVLFIGGGFSALLTSARLREHGFESIRIVERGSDVGGTWYWNRYPGAACDVVSYDYLPLLDELDYVPVDHYSRGPEIFGHCQKIAKKYNLYELAVFNTTVTETVWSEDEQLWHVKTDRGDVMRAQFVICANGTLAKPKLSTIQGMTSFAGHSFHTSRWDYDYTGVDLENLKDKVVGIIGTGASAVQIVPELAKNAKQLYVFQRTPSSIDVRDDWPTDPNWARKLEPGWQATRRAKVLAVVENSLEKRAAKGATSPEEKLRKQENANIDYMMRIHRRIDKIVDDKQTADALKPWYMFMCKRPCFHNDYLPAFNRPNVELVDTKGEGITEIGPKGPVFDGKTYDVDVLIYATGFEVQQTGIYNTIVGEGGVNLQDKYAEGIRTLLGIHTAGFPNLFIMGGYQASFQFNLTDMLQTQGDHIAACIDHVRRNGYHSLDVTNEAEEWWVQEVINHRGKTTRSEECTPGYYNMEGDSQRRQDGNYNGGFRQYFQHQGEVREKMEENFNLKAKP